MDKYEAFALGFFLCDYPEGSTYEQVLSLLEANCIEVTIWQPFEDYDGKWVAEEIAGMVDSLKHTFKEVENEKN